MGGDAGLGTIDIDALKTLVDFSAKGHPIIVIFSYIVQPSKEHTMMSRLLVKHLYLSSRKMESTRGNTTTPLIPMLTSLVRGFGFMHVDGALGTAYAPFLQMAYKNGLTELKPSPTFDFQLDFVSSIVTSGHKWIGAPWPRGIYISKTEFQLRPPKLAQIMDHVC